MEREERYLTSQSSLWNYLQNCSLFTVLTHASCFFFVSEKAEEYKEKLIQVSSTDLCVAAAFLVGTSRCPIIVYHYM